MALFSIDRGGYGEETAHCEVCGISNSKATLYCNTFDDIFCEKCSRRVAEERLVEFTDEYEEGIEVL